MAKRNKQWARTARARLLYILGGHCAACGTDQALTFDCIEPRGDSHHRGSTDQRMSFYRRQAQHGNLQILCASCNALKADLSKHMWNAALSMAYVRAGRHPNTPTPAQGGAEKSAQIRAHLTDIINCYAEAASIE